MKDGYADDRLGSIDVKLKICAYGLKRLLQDTNDWQVLLLCGHPLSMGL